VSNRTTYYHNRTDASLISCDWQQVNTLSRLESAEDFRADLYREPLRGRGGQASLVSGQGAWPAAGSASFPALPATAGYLSSA
jgi:hypothetical protein